MSDAAEQKELLEIYKLHSELADRVSQRREGANKLYASLITALIGGVIVLIRFGGNDLPVGPVFILVGIFGSFLSISWVLVILSYRQLNTGKLKALQEIEKKLVYPFFTKEWEFLTGKYNKLTVVETILPYILYLVFITYDYSWGYLVPWDKLAALNIPVASSTASKKNRSTGIITHGAYVHKGAHLSACMKFGSKTSLRRSPLSGMYGML